MCFPKYLELSSWLDNLELAVIIHKAYGTHAIFHGHFYLPHVMILCHDQKTASSPLAPLDPHFVVHMRVYFLTRPMFNSGIISRDLLLESHPSHHRHHGKIPRLLWRAIFLLNSLSSMLLSRINGSSHPHHFMAMYCSHALAKTP